MEAVARRGMVRALLGVMSTHEVDRSENETVRVTEEQRERKSCRGDVCRLNDIFFYEENCS